MVDRELLDREVQSLSKDEAEAVKKRVDTLTATLKKNKQQRADVREVFASASQVGCTCRLVVHTGRPVVRVYFCRSMTSAFIMTLFFFYNPVVGSDCRD